MDLTQRQRALTTEIHSVDKDILKLQELKGTLNAELRDITQELEDLARRRITVPTTADLHGPSNSGKGNFLQNSRDIGRNQNIAQNGVATINYFSQFDWTGELKRRMKRIFGFDEFRLCQEG
jgi:ATP-dependent DNA helicase Q1